MIGGCQFVPAEKGNWPELWLKDGKPVAATCVADSPRTLLAIKRENVWDDSGMIDVLWMHFVTIVKLIMSCSVYDVTSFRTCLSECNTSRAVNSMEIRIRV